MTATQPEVFAAQFPLAVQALGLHMQTHQLPPFWSIDVRGTDIVVLLRRNTDTAWISTLVVDAQREEERHPAGVPGIRTEYEVRLPDTGFRFTLAAYRPVPSMRPVLV